MVSKPVPLLTYWRLPLVPMRFPVMRVSPLPLKVMLRAVVSDMLKVLFSVRRPLSEFAICVGLPVAIATVVPLPTVTP